MNSAAQGKSIFSRTRRGWEERRAQQAEPAAPSEMTAGEHWEALDAQQHFNGDPPVSLLQPLGKGINSCLRLAQSGCSSKKDAGYFSCCKMPFLPPFQYLCIAPFCSMHTFPRAFCEDLSCLEAEGVDSIHAFPVTNTILFWFGPPLPLNRSESEKLKWQSNFQKDKKLLESQSENPGSPLQKFSARKTTTEVRAAHALNKQSTTHTHYVGKPDPKPTASR